MHSHYPRLCAFYLLSYLPASPRPFINLAAKFEVPTSPLAKSRGISLAILGIAKNACAAKSKTSVCSAWRRELPAFGPLGAGRFNPVNRRRDSFHRAALATLEHAVLEASQAEVYTLQIHAFPTRWAARTFGPQQLR